MTKKQWQKKVLKSMLKDMEIDFPENASIEELWSLFEQSPKSDFYFPQNKRKSDFYDRRRRQPGSLKG